MSEQKMQDLVLAERFFDDVIEKRKLGIIRKGKRDIVPGPLTFTSDINKDRTLYVNVTRVSFTRAKDFTPHDATIDDAATPADLYVALRKFYPDLTDETICTVIEFE